MPGVGYPRTSSTGNNKTSLGMENSSSIEYPDSWPQLVVWNEYNAVRKIISCYPFNHPKVLYKEEYGMSPEDPCIITEDKGNKILYIEVEKFTGYGILKCTHTIDGLGAPWGLVVPPELYVIGYINSTGFPVLNTEDLGFAHRETPTFPNPHAITFEQSLNRNARNRIILRSTDEITETAFIEIAVAKGEEANVTALRLNAYRQKVPALELLGSLRVGRSRYQSAEGEEGSSILMEASDGAMVKVQVKEINGNYNFSIKKE